MEGVNGDGGRMIQLIGRSVAVVGSAVWYN